MTLTLKVVDKGANGLKAEVLGNEFTDFAEESSEASLSANFGCELKGINHCLFLLVHLLLGLYLFNLHGKVGAENLEDLLVSRVEANVLVVTLDNA